MCVEPEIDALTHYTIYLDLRVEQSRRTGPLQRILDSRDLWGYEWLPGGPGRGGAESVKTHRR